MDVRPGAVFNLNGFSDHITGLVVYGTTSGAAATVNTGSGTLSLGSNGIGYGSFGSGGIGATIGGNLSFGGGTRRSTSPMEQQPRI